MDTALFHREMSHIRLYTTHVPRNMCQFVSKTPFLPGLKRLKLSDTGRLPTKKCSGRKVLLFFHREMSTVQLIARHLPRVKSHFSATLAQKRAFMQHRRAYYRGNHAAAFGLVPDESRSITHKGHLVGVLCFFHLLEYKIRQVGPPYFGAGVYPYPTHSVHSPLRLVGEARASHDGPF